ncbi:MAG: GGDEF domain-containing protein [Huintestinicola sp.]
MSKKQEKLRNLISDDTLRYRVVFGFSLSIHTVLIFLFYALGIKILAYFNVVSVLIYLVGILTVKNRKLAGFWLAIMFLEVVGHASLCNYLLGWGYGLSLYGLMIIPVTYYISYMEKNIKHSASGSTILSAIDVAAVVTTCLIGRNGADYPYLTLTTERTIFAMNMCICALALIVYCSLFTDEIRAATDNLEEKNKALDFLANYDELTKLRNRHHMSEVFDSYINGNRPYCVVLGDIDDFKQVNDHYGHQCGDNVLVQIAGIITRSVGNHGVVCRWGGEEILILASGTPLSGASLVAERIRAYIEDMEILCDEKLIRCTITAGAAESTEAATIEEIIGLADERLYIGKKSGKNTVVSE